ncbi:MAG TPA: hypothetical protein VGX26_08635 [Solirubrobacteraceae bacterium]|nr:hypothetical protein [Solirubrobacteraceae bacterium]
MALSYHVGIMRLAMRRMIVILALFAAGSLIVACGSGSHPTATTVASAAGTTKTDAVAVAKTSAASSSFTKPQAIRFAHAVNLTAPDVPGFKVSSEKNEHEIAAEKRLEHEMLRCVRTLGSHDGIVEGSHHAVVEMGSKEFGREANTGNESVQSEVTVVRTPALAAKELVVIRSPHVRVCLSHYLDLLFKSHKYRGATVSPVLISQGTPPAPGATGSFAWRITTTITVHNVRIPIYIDIFGFVEGSAEVSLFTAGVPKPFPAATEERLFSLLLTRAKTHGA